MDLDVGFVELGLRCGLDSWANPLTTRFEF